MVGSKPYLVLFLFTVSTWEASAQVAPLGASSFGLQDRSSGFGLTRDYNPAIGANLLLGAEYLSRDASGLGWPHAVEHGAGETGILFQEAEVGLAAAVDPYFRGDVIIALHRHEGEFHVEVEEGYVTTLFLPRVTLRGGKFYLQFGRHNVLHTHAFPFVDAPLTHTTFFGHEGLNEAAVEAAVLLPCPGSSRRRPGPRTGTTTSCSTPRRGGTWRTEDACTPWSSSASRSPPRSGGVTRAAATRPRGGPTCSAGTSPCAGGRRRGNGTTS